MKDDLPTFERLLMQIQDNLLRILFWSYSTHNHFYIMDFHLKPPPMQFRDLFCIRNKLKCQFFTNAFWNIFNIAFIIFWQIIVVKPARWALNVFSFTPPIGNTLPRSVISPVIPTSRRIGRFVNAETSAVAIVIPAEGPSFGTAPSGT